MATWGLAGPAAQDLCLLCNVPHSAFVQLFIPRCIPSAAGLHTWRWCPSVVYRAHFTAGHAAHLRWPPGVRVESGASFGALKSSSFILNILQSLSIRGRDTQYD